MEAALPRLRHSAFVFVQFEATRYFPTPFDLRPNTSCVTGYRLCALSGGRCMSQCRTPRQSGSIASSWCAPGLTVGMARATAKIAFANLAEHPRGLAHAANRASVTVRPGDDRAFPLSC
jgi:hypothetical protein